MRERETGLPNAQPRSSMSGRRRRKFQESCCKRRQNGSELSQQSTTHGRLDQKESTERQQPQCDLRWLHWLLNFRLKQTLTQPYIQVLAGGPLRVKFFGIISLCIFPEPACAVRFYVCKVLLYSAYSTQQHTLVFCEQRCIYT